MNNKNGKDNKYVTAVKNKFIENNDIFNESLIMLSIYIAKEDWNLRFLDFKEACTFILGEDPEEFCKQLGDIACPKREFSFKANKYERENNSFPEVSEEWLEYDSEFRRESLKFYNIFRPIISDYYEYTYNPTSIKKIVVLERYNSQKLRIIRNDGEYLDITTDDYDVNKLIEILKNLKY